MTTAKLLLHCPDKPGILAEVTDFITVNKGNIIYLDQYVCLLYTSPSPRDS